MIEARYPILVAILALPVGAALASYLVRDRHRLRHLAMAIAAALVPLAALPLAFIGLTGRAVLVDPWAGAAVFGGHPLFELDVLGGALLPFTAVLWALALGVAPRADLDAGTVRRSALGTAATLATFMTKSPLALVVLWAAAVAVLLLDLATGKRRRALRLCEWYLGGSTVLFAAGVVLLEAGPAAGGARATAGAVLVLVAVMIRKGIVPLHSWMPESFEHGKLGSTTLFSAPQAGAYVAATLLVPRAPVPLLTAIGVLSLLTGVYGALAALVQADARRAFGYLFMSQSALVMVGLESISVEGLTGSLCLWLSSGLGFAGLALCLRVLEARRGRLALDRYNGGYERMPLLATSFLLLGLACVGFPGTFGFIGTELLVDGAVARFPHIGFAVVVTTALTAIAMLRSYFALFCGRRDSGIHLRLRGRERALFAALAVLLFAGGLVSRPIVASRAAAAEALLAARRAQVQGERIILHVGATRSAGAAGAGRASGL